MYLCSPLFSGDFNSRKLLIVKALNYKTRFANKETVDRKWYIVDATGMTLGRMVTRIATILKGKHKPSYSPHVDCGDNVIVINSDKIHLSGNKWDAKNFITYSGYPGGQKVTSMKELNRRRPTAIVENAVRGMLPKTRLGREQFRNLFVYADDQHPHEAQKPETLKF